MSNQTAPQVAQPTATGKTGVATVYLVSGQTQLQGKVYLFPDYEEYNFILVKPSGSVAKNNKLYWQVYEQSTGYRIADTLTKNSTAQDALGMALSCLKAHTKEQWKAKLDEMRDRIKAHLAVAK